MTVTLFVNRKEEKVLSEKEMLDKIAKEAEEEIHDFGYNFAEYLNHEFTLKELFELTEDKRREIKEYYRQSCMTEYFEEIVYDMGYEAITVDI